MAYEVASLRDESVLVYVYPLSVNLVSGQRTTAGPFAFTLTDSPGAYLLQSSTDLRAWTETGKLTNELGSVLFIDAAAIRSPQKIYRARSAP